MSESDVVGLCVEISNLTSAISHQTDVISPQKLILDDVQTQLRMLQVRLDSIRHPSLFLSLPPEITSEIFIHCLPAEREGDVINTREAPLLLMRICRVWREISISTPELWTNFEAVDAARYSHFSEIADTWLKRAREHPLSLSVALDKTHDHNSDVMDVLQRYSSNIRSLELDMSGEDLSRMEPRIHDFTLLQELSIRLLPGVLQSFPAKIFSNTPLLHEVCLSNVLPSFLALPWQQLTEFTGKNYTRAQCLAALRLMPHVAQCAFSTYWKARGDPVEVFLHPNIQHLTLFGSPPPDPRSLGLYAEGMRVLEILNLPALQTLELRDVHFEETVLDQLILHSSPLLRELSVRPVARQTGGTELKLSPAFTSLGLTDLELRNLSFMGCRVANLEAMLLDIVEMAAAPMPARRQLAGCAQLQSFRVVSALSGYFYSESMFPTEVLQPFKDLKASGMDIYIGTKTRSII
ncbi:hypothetical protein B0H19DRAFT_1240374 [Mycena capillaripes]|nr:hypothetical protein B0H19DRAFT_1240374 [Mycena capillaripes]